ncbi:MAG: hypothetical protein GXO94_08655 [Nitrospirae bacterium]|nr:hypothetical protein [Nitrospirota bacterium]
MLRRLFVVIALVSSVSVGLWYAGIPDRWAAEWLQGVLSGERIRTEVYGFRKNPFFDFEMDGVRVVHSRKGLVSMERLSGRIHPLSLFLGGLKVSFAGYLSGGEISAEAFVGKGSVRAAVDIRSARLEDLDLLAASAFRGSGILDLTGMVDNGAGELYFEVRDLVLDDIRSGGLYIPMKSFSVIKGAGSFRKDGLKVESVSLEGEHMSGRIRNLVFSNGFFEGSLEIVTGPGLPDGTLALLKPFRRSRNYYVIPLKGKVREML